MFFDAHIHCIKEESGGFLIGLEGAPFFEGTLNNEQVLQLHNPTEKYIGFYYVNSEECCSKKILGHSYLKYHPRRERYSPKDVMASIDNNKPKAVILDTLNEPFWTPYDYWDIARKFSDVVFILAHAGGYLLNDFIKICHFQKNVWIDFALTQTTLGVYGCKEKGLAYIEDGIKYSLNSVFSHKILLASDYPFFSQEDVVQYYEKYLDKLNNNFINLYNQIL